jgi:mannose-6-phosphate isomerase-like protein (cupin superfamily)
MARLEDATHLYEVERRATHAERPGFRIRELQISPTQEIPPHVHSRVHDIFYVLEGRITLFLGDPDETALLAPGGLYDVHPGRPHRVANAGETSATFLILQGIGDYDYEPHA